MITNEVLRFEGLCKSYPMGRSSVTVLSDCDVRIASGMTAIVGPSGSGKSTLLRLAAGMDRPTAGHGYLDGRPIPYRSPSALREYREREVAMVWQDSHLLAGRTAEEQVAVPLRMRGATSRYARYQTREYLQAVGLASRRSHRPQELSGGEQQRVAVARAFACESRVILADEPTGRLDQESSKQILDLLRDLVDHTGRPVILVTHDLVAAQQYCDAVLCCQGGTVQPTDGPLSAKTSAVGKLLALEADTEWEELTTLRASEPAPVRNRYPRRGFRR